MSPSSWEEGGGYEPTLSRSIEFAGTLISQLLRHLASCDDGGGSIDGIQTYWGSLRRTNGRLTDGGRPAALPLRRNQTELAPELGISRLDTHLPSPIVPISLGIPMECISGEIKGVPVSNMFYIHLYDYTNHPLRHSGCQSFWRAWGSG